MNFTVAFRLAWELLGPILTEAILIAANCKYVTAHYFCFQHSHFIALHYRVRDNKQWIKQEAVAG
jgi:hypothetical protein